MDKDGFWTDRTRATLRGHPPASRILSVRLSMNYKEDYPSRAKKQPPFARKMKKVMTAFGHKADPEGIGPQWIAKLSIRLVSLIKLYD